VNKQYKCWILLLHLGVFHWSAKPWRCVGKDKGKPVKPSLPHLWGYWQGWQARSQAAIAHIMRPSCKKISPFYPPNTTKRPSEKDLFSSAGKHAWRPSFTPSYIQSIVFQ